LKGVKVTSDETANIDFSLQLSRDQSLHFVRILSNWTHKKCEENGLNEIHRLLTSQNTKNTKTNKKRQMNIQIFCSPRQKHDNVNQNKPAVDTSNNTERKDFDDDLEKNAPVLEKDINTVSTVEL
jgi:hypothetical protein